MGAAIGAWNPVLFSNTVANSTITYQFNSSTASTIGQFVSANWRTLVSGSIPTSSTAPYAAVRAILTTSSPSYTCSVDDITINWTDGSSVRAASAWLNQRYVLSVAVGNATNNRLFVYDKKQQWQRYSGISADAITRYGAKTLFSNSSGVFEMDNGYTDNGAAISSYFRSAARAPGGLDLFAKYQQLIVSTDFSDSTLSTTFRPDLNTDFSFGSVQMNDNLGFQNIKLPFNADSVQQSRFIDFKWAVTGTSFWRILNANLYFTPDVVPQ